MGTDTQAQAQAQRDIRYLLAKEDSQREESDHVNVTSINDLPLEVLRMILQELYHQVALQREPSFYTASCVARRWTDIAYDLSFFRFYRFCHGLGATVPMIRTVTKLQALGNSEGLRRAVVWRRSLKFKDKK